MMDCKRLSYIYNKNDGIAIVITLCILIILSIIGVLLSNLSTTELLVARNNKVSTKAFYFAESGVEAGCRNLHDVNATMDGGSYAAFVSSPRKIQNATYNGTSRWNIYEYTVNSTGYFKDAVQKVQVEIRKKNLPLDVDAAVAVYTQGANATAETTAQGSPLVDGADYGLPDPFVCSGTACNVPSPEMNGTGTYGVYMDHGSVNIKGAAEISPGWKIGNGTYANDYWVQVADELVPEADTVFNSTIGVDVQFGTRTDPQITVFGSNAKFTGTINGAGILIVHGDARCLGNFHFEGYVLILGDSDEVQLFSAGTPYIYGSVIVAGSKNPEVTIKGNANIKFSNSALENASNMDKFTRRVYWREIQ